LLSSWRKSTSGGPQKLFKTQLAYNPQNTTNEEHMANPPVAPLPIPGFVSVIFDVPFPISVPDDDYTSFDPQKIIAVVTVKAKSGTRAFFRTGRITGLGTFENLHQQPLGPQRPRENRNYLAASTLPGGTEIPTLNVNTGEDGGYAESKYFSEVTITYLADDINSIADQNNVFRRACEILNPFLDKYRVINQDYRISPVSMERNFYFAQCHTSLLEVNERGLDVDALFATLRVGRHFNLQLGQGATNILRVNSYELLGPRSPITGGFLQTFKQFIKEDYVLPLSYALILEALAYMQRHRDYRLAIVHAETAVEVHDVHLLTRLMQHLGKTQIEIDQMLENDRNYWGVKNKLRRLDDWTQRYCQANGHAYQAFVGSVPYNTWESDLYKKRNAAVHGGANSFTYAEASAGIHAAKECIKTFETRCPGFQDKVQLDPSMTGFRMNAGEVMF
jgi:hypothetical protein